MKATQTNTAESECDTEWGVCKQEKDSDQPRKNGELVSKIGAPQCGHGLAMKILNLQ